MARSRSSTERDIFLDWFFSFLCSWMSGGGEDDLLVVVFEGVSGNSISRDIPLLSEFE